MRGVKLSQMTTLAIAFVGACGDDGPKTTCGAGTTRVDDVCVPDSSGGTPGGGGDDGRGGSAANGSDGGTTPRGGTANAGAGNEPGTEGGAGGGGDGGTGPGGAPANDGRWLAVDHVDGVLAYDVTRFPSPEGAVNLGTGSMGENAWSPDGALFAYADSSGINVRPVTTDGFGEAYVVTSSGFIQWSADSRSWSVIANQRLVVTDPTRAAASLHVLTETLPMGPVTSPLVEWSPTGSKLLYVDADGAHVVDVTDGVPGTQRDLLQDASSEFSRFVWSPRGDALAHADRESVTLIDVSGETAESRVLTDPSIASPLVFSLRFSHDGSLLAFDGHQTRADADVYVVDVDANDGPVLISSDYDEPYSATLDSFSPIEPRLFYNVSLPGASLEYNVVDLGDGLPGETVELGLPPLPTQIPPPLWVPSASGLVARSPNLSELRHVDASGEAVLLADETPTTIPRAAVHPAGDVVGYSVLHALKLARLDGSESPATVPINSNALDRVGFWEWSADGGFVALVDEQRRLNPDAFVLTLIRVDGTIASAPFPIAPVASAFSSFAWQPVPRP